MNTEPPAEYQLIPGILPSTSHIPNSVAESLQTSRDPQSLEARRLEAYIADALRRYHRMGGSVDLLQRKSVSEVTSEYISALSRKKNAVIALASAQVSCEESEAVLFEAYGEAHLKRIHSVYYVTDNPESAVGRYSDAVSAIRFDPLE